MKSTKFMFVLSLALVLVACDVGGTESGPVESPVPSIAPTSTPEPTEPPSTGLACLSGTWELVNVENYMNSVVPPELAAGLTFIGNSGTVSVNFVSDGTYTYTWNEFQVQYTMDVGSGPVPLEIDMNGDGSGIFEPIDDHHLSFTDLEGSGMTIEVLMGGETIDLGMDEAVSALGGPDTTFEFDCDGDTLLTYPPIEGALPVEYARVP
jgi:hypothetical protein